MISLLLLLAHNEMDAGTAAIIVACITTLGGIVVGFMQSFKKESKEARKENREDHAVVQMQLRMIYKGLNKVDDKLEQHIQSHGEGTYGKTVEADRGNASQ
jgi:hypothetical protein